MSAMQARRRVLVAALALACPARNAPAQARRHAARIAVLDDATEASRAPLWKVFEARLRELGHVEGASIVFERRWANRDAERLPALAAELVATEPDVIVAVTTTAALAAKRATSRIPVVAIGPADPVRSGLIASLARPGGNVTGVSPNQSEISGKWIELIREVVPRAQRFAYLTDGSNPGETLVFRELEEKSRRIGLTVRLLDGRTKRELDLALASLQRDSPDALVVATTAALLPHRDDIVASANRARVPAIYARREYADHGGLLSYGADGAQPFARAADYVDKILKGAAPSELPFEMASTFELVVNHRTAQALGVRIPAAVLARADAVIR